MNREWNFIVFLSIFIFCVSITSKTTEAASEEVDQVIVTEAGQNVTLHCNPLLRENTTLSSQISNIEWTTDDDIPLFTSGKLWQYLFDYKHNVDNSSFTIENNPPGTLNILNTPMMKNITFTCTFFTPSTKISYSYLLQIKGNNKYGIYNFSSYPIPLKNRRDRVVLPCAGEFHNGKIAPTADFSYVWLSRLSHPTRRSEIEVISLNRNIVSSKYSTEGYHVAEDGSLIIESLNPSWINEYQCHTTINQAFSHYIDRTKNEMDELANYPQTLLKIKFLHADYGTRNFILACPSTNNNETSSFHWLFSDASLLFFNREYFEYNLKSPSNFYEVNDDGSLVILVVRLFHYGQYTCRRSTGEEYIYVLDRKFEKIKETILIKRNTSSVTLPCPLNDPRDRELNLITWHLMMSSARLYGIFDFVDGRITPSRRYEIPENIKLSEDKTSLIVSNFTPINSINDIYMCKLVYSDTTYYYRLISEALQHFISD